MMVAAFLVGCAMQAAPPTPPVGDVLVVADGKAKEQHVGDICQLPQQEAEEHLESMGYHLYERGEDRVLFAPSLWQDEAMRRSMKMYSTIASKVGPDGVLSMADATVREFAQEFFSYDGIELKADSTVVVRLSRSYSMVSGNKKVDVAGPDNLSPADRSRLESHPVHSTGRPLVGTKPLDDTVAEWPATFAIFGFGRLAVPTEDRMAEFGRAVAVLQARLAGYYRAKRNAYTAMNMKLAGADVSKEYGKAFSSLSRSLQQSLLDNVKLDYANYGFQSAADAASFLQGAALGSTNAYAMMTVCTGSYKNTPQFMSWSVP